jgi:hypothetical protein
MLRFKAMGKEQKAKDQPEGEFNAKVSEEEIDKATLDSFLLEHPGVSEEAARLALAEIKRREQKEEK